MQIQLDAVATSALRARRFVTEALAGWDDSDLLDSAVLLVSELVTNAVVHAHSPTQVTIVPLPVRAAPDSGPAPVDGDAGSPGGGVRVEVYDEVIAEPRPRAFDLDATSGRGLALVAAISDRWGVDLVSAGAPGKRIWFELHVRSAAC